MSDTKAEERARELLKPHEFRVGQRRQDLGGIRVESSAVDYWKAVHVVADLLTKLDIAERPADYADFRGWLAAHDAEVARQQCEKIADFLSTPGVLWHGDDGVTVYADGPYGGNRMKLTDWLRTQFPEETGR